jgi:hypothetical protein
VLDGEIVALDAKGRPSFQVRSIIRRNSSISAPPFGASRAPDGSQADRQRISYYRPIEGESGTDKN